MEKRRDLGGPGSRKGKLERGRRNRGRKESPWRVEVEKARGRTEGGRGGA